MGGEAVWLSPKYPEKLNEMMIVWVQDLHYMRAGSGEDKIADAHLLTHLCKNLATC